MEASPKPHLHLVDENGEATAVCADCTMYERDLRGKRLRIAQLEAALAEQQGTAEDSQAIRTVLNDWCDLAVSSLWWTKRPRFKPGDERWKAAKRRYGDYDIEYLLTVNRGAFMANPKAKARPDFSRTWLMPPTIYGAQMEGYYEYALDPERQWVKAVLEAPTVLRERWLEVLDLADICDCTHARLDHQKPALRPDGLLTYGECLVHGCHCSGFDKDFYRDEKVVRWMETQ